MSYKEIFKCISTIFIAVILFFSVILCLLVTIDYITDYDKKEVKAFNEINDTEYTYKEWMLYEYEIKKLYPLKSVK